MSLQQSCVIPGSNESLGISQEVRTAKYKLACEKHFLFWGLFVGSIFASMIVALMVAFSPAKFPIIARMILAPLFFLAAQIAFIALVIVHEFFTRKDSEVNAFDGLMSLRRKYL